ncbi:hypothetical protein JQ031_19550 [Clostridium botulinum]|nr:hypothetical protein [Clostridium botulinum]
MSVYLLVRIEKSLMI